MALIQCSECGKEISDQISACPHCGYPVQKQTDENKGNNKKKLLLPIIIAGIILVLIAIIFICYKLCIRVLLKYPNPRIASNWEPGLIWLNT